MTDSSWDDTLPAVTSKEDRISPKNLNGKAVSRNVEKMGEGKATEEELMRSREVDTCASPDGSST